MTDNPLHIKRNGAILEVILDRPKANAIDGATSRRMGQVFTEFRDDPELRVAIRDRRRGALLLSRLGSQGRGGGRTARHRTTASGASAVCRNCPDSTNR